MEGYKVKVLTKNIEITFECTNECPSHEIIKTDPSDLADSGPPVCSMCNNVMEISDQCIVKN